MDIGFSPRLDGLDHGTAARAHSILSVPESTILGSKSSYLPCSRNVLHSGLLMGGGDASVVVKRTGRAGLSAGLQRYYASIAVLFTPNWDVTILRHLRNFVKQVAIGSGRIIAK
jgi:hypothetical protein